LPYKNCLTK
jgi:hypothetical protein